MNRCQEGYLRREGNCSLEETDCTSVILLYTDILLTGLTSVPTHFLPLNFVLFDHCSAHLRPSPLHCEGMLHEMRMHR